MRPLEILLLTAASCVACAACAPGERVGTIGAFNASPSTLDVDVAAGETLRFTVDCDVDMNGLENIRQGHRGSLAVDAVQRSQLAVTVKDAKGSLTVRCPLKGNGTTEGKSGSKLYYEGLIVDCAVPIAEAGKRTVSATVAWDPAIKPLSAKVDVRRVKK